MTEQVNACDQGLVDMTIAVLTYEKNRVPLHEVLDFGFMGWDGPMLNRVWSDLNKSIPEFEKEISSSFFELFRFIPTPRYLHHNKEGGRVPADFKGVIPASIYVFSVSPASTALFIHSLNLSIL